MLVIALGPAASAGVVKLIDRPLWCIVGPAVACVALADASQYSKGEVERIWLLFMPWLLVATASLLHKRGRLAAQLATALLLLQSWLVWKW